MALVKAFRIQIEAGGDSCIVGPDEAKGIIEAELESMELGSKLFVTCEERDSEWLRELPEFEGW